ncbi:MAG: sugar phosphate isomerase/epimerase family protein [Sumerlaeia bacterium]
MKIALQIPHALPAIELVQRLGLGTVQLRVGPGFPLDMGDRTLADVKVAARQLKDHGLTVGALGFYRNMLAPNPAEREDDLIRLHNTMQAAEVFETDLIGVFAGRDPDKTLEDNLPEFERVWAPLAKTAEDRGVRLAFENCTMLRGFPPRGINMSCTPAILDAMFQAVDSPALGIEYDPSHLMKQMIDPVRFLQHFRGRILHVHAKDHEVVAEELYRHGRFDLRASRDRFPGFGQTDFATIVAELKAQNYGGPLTIEAERDPEFTDDAGRERGLKHSVAFLSGLL